jgi:gliding motility-associated-like protein
LPNEYISEVPNQQVIYLRVERGNDCFGINSMTIEVLPVPSYVNIPDQILCSMTPGFFDIILSDYDIQVLNGQNPDQYVISYHTSADDAENGVNALENAYTVVDQIDLFVRIEDNITACYISNIDFTLTVEPKPLFTPPDQPIIVCDEDTDGFTTIDISIMTEDIMRGPDGAIIEENIVTYHETAEDMNLGANAIEDPAAYVNIANPQIVYVRIEDNMTPSTGCYADTTLELIVQTPPVVNEPSSLEYCDPDADGFGVFDLTTANVEIANGLENLVISYHETEVDAENNVNAIVNADEYNNIVADVQTVYIRVEDNASDNDCASQLTLTLIVNDVPQINTEPSSLSLCDENADGFGIFDLSTSSEELLNGLDPNDFTITYYEAEDDAENALNAIVTPYNYTNTTAFNQFVWVRIENNITACYNLGSIELIINELPILTQPSPLNLCDDNNNGDEVEGFTLEDSIGEVLQGQTGINISFHESQEDADNAVNPIVSPYNNTANAQTIYIRGEDEITGCYATITLDLRVNPIPSPITPEPIEECDDDNDGFTFFTLETNEEEIINGELDIILSYYSTLTNAQNDVNPIISPYYNIVPDNQIIYVRAENELTGCFTIVEQELITIPSPEIPLIIEDIVICDDDYDDIALFDLTQREEDILGEQSSSEVILTYHESLLDAETGDNPIINTTSYQNLSNPQTIYVRLEDTVNGCINTGTFNLVVTLPPVIVQADPLQVCDDEIADQITEFDLTIKDSEITGGNIDWEVIYYETQQDAFNAINPIENPEAYSNTSVQGNPANPQTLYVAVVNEFGCIAYNYLTIEVLPNPTPNLDPSNIEQCDNNNAGDLTETFDITIHEDYILNGESGVSIAYHESLDDALSGINPITGPSNYVNVIPGVQTIYVAVTKNITGCVTVVTFDIIVNPLPDISSVADIVICEVNTDNIYDFDLDEITVQLLGSQDISNFTVTYHETQQDAEDGLNVLTSPYTNTTSPQQLFVNISNNTTGCFVTGAGFTLDVQEAAVANTDAEPALLEECDIDNDGFAQFILTGLNQDILDGLDANDFTVGYYENLQDAEDSSNALPNNYTNTSSPQIIYVRLDNDTDPSSQCYDITTATLIVNELPFFSLEASYMGCENANGSEVVDSLMETNFPESEYDFEWYDPTGTLVATTSSYFPTMAGTYTATVTNELTGCQFSTTTEVYTSATAVVSATVTTLAFAQEHVIQATATGIGDYEFRLDTGPWQLDGTFNNVSPGLHTVYVRDLNGCGMGTATVLVVDYPRFFTPNGDGYNDTWHIIGADLHPGLVTSDIYIFDRYGKLLKKLDPQGDGWDGTYNGRPMPSTDYWFTIEYQIPALNVTRRFRAHFSLKR